MTTNSWIESWLSQVTTLKDLRYSEFGELKELLIKSASKYDVIIFDRQLQTNDDNKTGVDLLKECVGQK